MTDAPLLQMRGIHKSFPGVKALEDVDLQLHSGEVLALMGENGAGKSTLIKILSGGHRVDSGEILIDGKPCELRETEHPDVRWEVEEYLPEPDGAVWFAYRISGAAISGGGEETIRVSSAGRITEVEVGASG